MVAAKQTRKSLKSLLVSGGAQPRVAQVRVLDAAALSEDHPACYSGQSAGAPPASARFPPRATGQAILSFKAESRWHLLIGFRV